MLTSESVNGGLTTGRASPSKAASAVQMQVRRDVYVVVRIMESGEYGCVVKGMCVGEI